MLRIQARLKQWAHWARAQDPGFFFLELPIGCGKKVFLNELSYYLRKDKL